MTSLEPGEPCIDVNGSGRYHPDRFLADLDRPVAAGGSDGKHAMPRVA